MSSNSIPHDTAESNVPNKSFVPALLLEHVRDSDTEFFHTPDERPYVYWDGRVLPVDEDLLPTLAAKFLKAKHRIALGRDLRDFLPTLVGMAREGREVPVYRRVAACDGAIYIDLRRGGWVVEVTAEDWTVIPARDAPVYFIEPEDCGPLPFPEKGGKLQDLRELLGLDHYEYEWRAVLLFLVSTLNPTLEYPFVAMSGPDGRGKSTVTRAITRLVDPAKGGDDELGTEVEDVRDLVAAANARHVVSIDNLPRLTSKVSRCLCVLSTGGTRRERAMYFNFKMVKAPLHNPVIVNGLDELATEKDLLRRTIPIDMWPIDAGRLKSKQQFLKDLEKLRPKIFGCLLNAVVTGLQRQNSIQLQTEDPSLRGTVEWWVACAPALGLSQEDVEQTWATARAKGLNIALTADPLAQCVLDFLEDQEQEAKRHKQTYRYVGTVGSLKRSIEDRLHCSQKRPPARWPESPKGMGAALVRMEQGLRAEGWNVVKADKPGRNGYAVTIERIEVGRTGRASA